MTVLNDQAAREAPTYNEAKVRMQIIDPIIRRLGYTDNSDLYFELEETLRYPYIHIGRKNPKRDVPLGKVDYRAGLKGRRGSFIIEAKAGSVDLSSEEIEQAHSYAAHALVGANFFVLCNGSHFQIFETLSGVGTAPIVDLPLIAVNDRFHEIEAILAPERLEKHCHIEYDVGIPLSPGLGSQLRFLGGFYTSPYLDIKMSTANGMDLMPFAAETPQFTQLMADIDRMKTMRLSIRDGLIQRNQDGRILVDVEFDGITSGNHENMRLLGLSSMQFVTSSPELSRSADAPTLFESDRDFSIAKGTNIFQMFAQTPEPAQMDVKGDLFISAQLHLQGSDVLGVYAAKGTYWFDAPMVGPVRFDMQFGGEVEGRTG